MAKKKRIIISSSGRTVVNPHAGSTKPGDETGKITPPTRPSNQPGTGGPAGPNPNAASRDSARHNQANVKQTIQRTQGK